ncbi:B3 DNA binding domain containing protein [Trema orientale]|uniref:B3 DNA binding domain containing protein n=1 Tax=Trema orientale TaxID=63057 RepID=A0A2P5F344_TREOI|nr:B3 DNA binding domain containing protein [Trema orientale]
MTRIEMLFQPRRRPENRSTARKGHQNRSDTVDMEVGPAGEGAGALSDMRVQGLMNLPKWVWFCSDWSVDPKFQQNVSLLELPKKFVWLHGEALSSTVFLKLPCGQQWEIGLLKSDGKVYLQQGWPKFTEHYQLDNGYLLYFRYEGNSHFGVSICGLSTCQIEYPSIPTQSDGKLKVPSRKEKTEEANSVTPPTSQAQKRMRTSATGMCPLGHVAGMKSQVSQKKTESGGSKFKISKTGSGRTYKSYKDSRALEAASSFSSPKPFFKKVVRDHPSACYNLRLPKNFVDGHLERKDQIVILQAGAKNWHVNLLKCQSGYFFAKGWNKFLTGNSLHPGDVCIYELIEKNQALLKVSIFKRNAV